MKQEDIPKVNSINITPEGVNELDWLGTILHMIDKSPEGSIESPCKYYPELEEHVKYIVATVIHEN